MLVFEVLKVVLLAIIEGITEWLPVSSTGHMILFDEILRLDASVEFWDMFLVVIQLGAILSVPILFWDRLNPLSSKRTAVEKRKTRILWSRVIVGSMPVAVLGFFFDDLIEDCFYSYTIVAISLIVYGIAFIIVEKIRAEKKNSINHIDELTYSDALKIGAFQSLSLIPGTSRSGATILGGMLSGVSREVSAEFSFIMAIPIMLGASGLKVVKFILSGGSLSAEEALLLAVGIIVSFVVSLIVIKFLMEFVKRHDFKFFGYYRIALGLTVLIYFLIKKV